MKKHLSLSPLSFMSANKKCFSSAKSAKSVKIAKVPKSAIICSIKSLNPLNGYTVNYICSNYSMRDVR